MILQFFVSVAILAALGALLHGAYLIVQDKDRGFKEKKLSEKNFNNFLKENDYKVLGKLTGVKKDD